MQSATDDIMTEDEAVQKVLTHVDKMFEHSVTRLCDLLRIPSISTQTLHRKDCRRAAQWLCDDLQTLGFQSRLDDVHWAKPGHPMVVGHSENAVGRKGGAVPHILFYGHYDVQPVDPEALWDAPPFEPQRKFSAEGREVLIARGASDDKGQVMTFLEACRAWKEVYGSLPLDISILLEGEEECGGENLLPFLKANKEELSADLVLVCDTSMASRTIPAITTSLRGMVAEEVEISCASHDLHSGVYGNAAANPIAILCQALASLRDDKGGVTLQGFYDGIRSPDEATRQAWRKIYPDDSCLLGEAGLSIAAGERAFSAIEQTWCRPSCEINGISGGYEGEGFKTVLPAKARAKISFRLVPGQDPEKIRASFRAHMREALPADATIQFTSFGGSPGFEVSPHNAYLPVALKALSEEWNTHSVTTGCGGSIPVAEEVRQALGLDVLMIGFAQSDDRIHSPNEQYGLDSFHKGIRSWVRILAELTKVK